MASYWCSMLFYLLGCVLLVKSFPTSFLREHISIPDSSDNLIFNGSKIVNIRLKDASAHTKHLDLTEFI